MIEQPGFRLQLQHADRDLVHPEGPTADRVRQFMTRHRQSTSQAGTPCRVTIQRDVPAHNGLGSGTQLGLAVASGLTALAGRQDENLVQLARHVGRGERSAVGIHGFAHGGLIVDAGHCADDDIGALACRLPLPPDWRILLITPRDSRAGLSGTGEERAFGRLGSMPLSLTDRLCRLVVTELLPAVQSACFAEFSRAVNEYGRLVGEFFAPVQGGVFGHPQTDALLERLTAQGIDGAGQTSWGPTVFAFVPDADRGRHVAVLLAGDADVQLVAPRNRGADIAHESAALP